MFFLTDPDIGPGLCPAGAQQVIDEIHAAVDAGTLAVDTSVVIGAHSTQAGGIDNSPSARAESNVTNVKGIDHLADNAELGAFLGASIPPAFAVCGP